MNRIAILACVLALGAGGMIGCVTASTVTDGDRQIVDQGRKGLEGAVEDLEKAQATVSQSSESWTMIGLGIAKLKDVQRGAAQLQKVHGPPKEPKEYSPENMTAAIAQSEKEHAGTPWGSIALGIGGVVAGVAGTMLGMPWLSSLFPALTGKMKVMADTGLQIVTALRRKAEQDGGIGAKDILSIAKEYNVTAGIQALVAPKAAALEQSLGYKPAVKLHEVAHAEAAAAVAAEPAPST